MRSDQCGKAVWNASHGHCTCSQALIALLFRPSHDSKLRQTWSVIHRCAVRSTADIRTSRESPCMQIFQSSCMRYVGCAIYHPTGKWPGWWQGNEGAVSCCKRRPTVHEPPLRQVAGLDGGAGRTRAARGRHAAGAPPCAPYTYLGQSHAPSMKHPGKSCACAVVLSTYH